MVGTLLDCRASHSTRPNLVYSCTRWSAYLCPCFPEVDGPEGRACDNLFPTNWVGFTRASAIMTGAPTIGAQLPVLSM